MHSAFAAWGRGGSRAGQTGLLHGAVFSLHYTAAFRWRKVRIAVRGSSPGCGCPRNLFHLYHPKSIAGAAAGSSVLKSSQLVDLSILLASPSEPTL
ncbi:hypothetical protein TNCV_4272491 [Trichonephila clavipes]|nr:hypothetical protein TNCV_4272491 [Trichonephila clavipes]